MIPLTAEEWRARCLKEDREYAEEQARLRAEAEALGEAYDECPVSDAERLEEVLVESRAYNV